MDNAVNWTKQKARDLLGPAFDIGQTDTYITDWSVSCGILRCDGLHDAPPGVLC